MAEDQPARDQEAAVTETEGGSGEKKEAPKTASEKKKTFTHILTDDVPVYVGEGQGDMTYEFAEELAKTRTAAKARGGGAATGAVQPQSPNDQLKSMADTIKTLLDVVRGNNQGKTYVIKPSEDGGPAEIEEIQPGAPIVAPAAKPQQLPGRSYYIDDDGEAKEVDPGRPLVIIKKEKPAAGGDNSLGPVRTYMIDKNTGEKTLVEAGAPIIIIQKPEATQGNQPVIQLGNDAQGKPQMIDLATYFRMEEHKEGLAQKREKHDMQLGLLKEGKKLISKGMRAFAHMSGEEPVEEEGEEEQGGANDGEGGSE